VGRHAVPEELPPPEDKPRYRFVVAISAIFLLAFASMAMVAAVFPQRAPQAQASPDDPAGSGDPFPPIATGQGSPTAAPLVTIDPANGKATTPPTAAIGLVAGKFQLSRDWKDGFIGSVQLSNGTSSAQAWQVLLVFPNNVKDLQARWIAGGPGEMTITRTGQTVTFTGQTSLAAGARLGVFFQFEKTVGSTTPRTCSVNGHACTA
jgi:Cellulose binding domain